MNIQNSAYKDTSRFSHGEKATIFIFILSLGIFFIWTGALNFDETKCFNNIINIGGLIFSDGIVTIIAAIPIIYILHLANGMNWKKNIVTRYTYVGCLGWSVSYFIMIIVGIFGNYSDEDCNQNDSFFVSWALTIIKNVATITFMCTKSIRYCPHF